MAIGKFLLWYLAKHVEIVAGRGYFTLKSEKLVSGAAETREFSQIQNSYKKSKIKILKRAYKVRKGLFS